MLILKKLDTYLGYFESGLLVVILGSMVILGFVQVLLRNFFDQGIGWVDPLLRHLVLWIAFLGASISTSQEKHINIDIVSRLLTPRGRLITKIITNLASVVVTGFLTQAAYVFVRDEKVFGSTIFGDFPAWIMELVIPIVFGLIAIRFLGHAIAAGLALKAGVPQATTAQV